MSKEIIGNWKDLEDLRYHIEKARGDAALSGNKKVHIEIDMSLADVEWLIASLQSAENIWKNN